MIASLGGPIPVLGGAFRSLDNWQGSPLLLDTLPAAKSLICRNERASWKIAVSVVRLRPWAPFPFNDLAVGDRSGSNEFASSPSIVASSTGQSGLPPATPHATAALRGLRRLRIRFHLICSVPACPRVCGGFCIRRPSSSGCGAGQLRSQGGARTAWLQACQRHRQGEQGRVARKGLQGRL